MKFPVSISGTRRDNKALQGQVKFFGQQMKQGLKVAEKADGYGFKRISSTVTFDNGMKVDVNGRFKDKNDNGTIEKEEAKSLFYAMTGKYVDKKYTAFQSGGHYIDETRKEFFINVNPNQDNTASISNSEATFSYFNSQPCPTRPTNSKHNSMNFNDATPFLTDFGEGLKS
jgi:hypothetical protein